MEQSTTTARSDKEMETRKQFINSAAAMVLSGAAVVASAPAHSCSADSPYLGSVCMTAATFCPANTHIEANGQLLPVSQYTALFSLLSNNYGGDGRVTFGVPDMRGRTPVGVGAGPGLTPVIQGTMRGNETTTLSTGNLAAHTHPLSAAQTAATTIGTSVPAQSADGNQDDPAPNHVLAGAVRGTQKIYSDVAANTSIKGPDVAIAPLAVTGTVGNTGSNQSFSNLPPQMGVKYCIAVQGVYPSRP
jgi:microcystin-dependent protein